MKCAYCHDELDVAATCVECQTAMHFECWEELPDCPTLGCEAEVKRSPCGWAASLLGFLFILISAANYKVNPVYGPIYWECFMSRLGEPPPTAEELKVRMLADPVDEIQVYLNSTARVLRRRMDKSPRNTVPVDSRDLVQCRRRVVGRKKEIPWDVDPALLPFQNMG